MQDRYACCVAAVFIATIRKRLAPRLEAVILDCIRGAGVGDRLAVGSAVEHQPVAVVESRESGPGRGGGGLLGKGGGGGGLDGVGGGAATGPRRCSLFHLL